MKGPNALLKFIGKAALNAVGGGILGDLAIDVLPEVAQDVWQWWGKKRSPGERLAEVEEIVQATPAEIHEAVVEVVEEVAADKPEEVKEALFTYLNQVPTAMRRSLRRPADPSGRTVGSEQSVKKAEDLLPFLPTRLPRFKPGDRPLRGVDYELVELLGVGGFGEVWKARNRNVDALKEVALKFCLDETARDQLLRHEATVLNQVMRVGSHKGIIPLKQTYLDGEHPCLEYEFVSGGDLTSVILQLHRQADKNMEVIIDQTTSIIEKLADIIAFAHQCKPPIVHRDLKPANILVQREEDGFTLRIADFGIGGVVANQNIKQTRATALGERHSIVRGAYTPLYASPQQMKAEAPDPRDDVHALGVIWYQMLTGDLSKGCPGGTAWTKKLKEQGMEKKLIELLTSCFEEDPDDRPADAGKLVDRLREINKGSKGPSKKPILQLDEKEAKVFERYAAAKMICDEAKDEMEDLKEAAQQLIWKKMLRVWQENRAKPENPKIAIPGGRATGVAQIAEKMKVELEEGQNLISVLLAAGFTKECAEKITSDEVAVESELTLRTSADLGKANPELLAKIKQVLQTNLSPAEQEEAFVPTISSKVKKGFLERASVYAESQEELTKLLDIIKPQFSLTGVTFQGDLEKVFREIHGKKDRVALRDTECG